MAELMATKEYFIKAVSAAVSGKRFDLPQDVNYRYLLYLARRNAVTTLILDYFESCPDEGIKNKAVSEAKMSVMRNAEQDEEIRKIREDFTRENIDFMFLKGVTLKDLYPSRESRFMVDMDVLVREEDLPKAKEILLSHALNLEFDNGKDIIFVLKPFLTVELHRSLFQEDFFMYSYFSNPWSRTVKLCGREYKMSENDLYIYTLAHLTEHYMESGSCFRPTVDLYLLDKTYELDFEYINSEFRKLNIAEFASNIRRLYLYLFANGEADETVSLIENYIILGAPVKNASAASKMAASGKSKSRRFLETAFPPLRHMQLKYPLLKKIPVLLPVFWLIRLVKYTFTKDRSLVRKREELKNADAQSADILGEIFKRSGLL